MLSKEAPVMLGNEDLQVGSQNDVRDTFISNDDSRCAQMTDSSDQCKHEGCDKQVIVCPKHLISVNGGSRIPIFFPISSIHNRCHELVITPCCCGHRYTYCLLQCLTQGTPCKQEHRMTVTEIAGPNKPFSGVTALTGASRWDVISR